MSTDKEHKSEHDEQATTVRSRFWGRSARMSEIRPLGYIVTQKSGSYCSNWTQVISSSLWLLIAVWAARIAAVCSIFLFNIKMTENTKTVSKKVPFLRINIKCWGSPSFCCIAALSKLSPGWRGPAEPRWMSCPCSPGGNKDNSQEL